MNFHLDWKCQLFPCWTFMGCTVVSYNLWPTCIVVVQSLRRVWLCNPWTAACQASLSFTISLSFVKLMSIESVMPSKHLILCCPLFMLSIFPSIRVFSSELALRVKWPKYWSLSFSIVFPVNIQGWFPFGWTGWISLQSKGLSTVFSNTTVQKHWFFST